MDDGFKKLDLNEATPAPQKEETVNPSPKTQMPRRKLFKTRKFKVTAAVVGILLLLFVYSAFRTFAIYKEAQKVYKQSKAVSDAAKKQNVVLVKDELVKTQEETKKLKKEMGSLAFTKFIPIIGGYYSDGEHLVNAASYGINAAIVTTDSIIPYADVLGLKGDKSFVGGSAEDRIRLAVKTLGKVVPKIDDIETQLLKAKEEVDKVNINRYPNFWVMKKVRTQMEMAKSLADQGVNAVQQGKPLIKVLPELLGEPKAKKYLVLFQNDKELRPTGGFLTYYSIFRVDQGVIHIDSSSDIYKLDDSIGYHPTAPAIILKYLPQVSTLNIRDINLSPDFGESMKAFNGMYAKSSMKTDYDGIIGIDTQFLVHIIDVLGEVQAGGQTFTSKNDPQCNCPQVVYQLELNTTKPVGYVRENRKAIVGELLYATMQKAFSSSPKKYWGPLFQKALTDASEKHILFALNDASAQQGIDALNWGGKIKSFEGDYLHINDANFGGAKSNMYTTSAVRMDYNVGSDGSINKTIKITYKNPEKYSDCNLERGGLCLNAILRNLQRLYVPEGSSLESSKGSQVKVETKKELGKSYFESFFTVNPLGMASITYNYKLPFKLKQGSPLPLLIQKQPGVEAIPFEIYVNGRKSQTFDLRADKELVLNI